MPYETRRDCLAEPGFVGCPHCGGPVDVRAEMHGAVSGFLNRLLTSLEATKKGKAEPLQILERVAFDAAERWRWYAEDVFPYDLLAPYWVDGLAPLPKNADAPSETQSGDETNSQEGMSPPSDSAA